MSEGEKAVEFLDSALLQAALITGIHFLFPENKTADTDQINEKEKSNY